MYMCQRCCGAARRLQHSVVDIRTRNFSANSLRSTLYLHYGFLSDSMRTLWLSFIVIFLSFFRRFLCTEKERPLLMSLHSWSFCLGLRNVYIIIPNRCSKWMNIVWPLCLDYLCIMCKLVSTKYEISQANSCRFNGNTWPYYSCLCSFLCIPFDSFSTRFHS